MTTTSSFRGVAIVYSSLVVALLAGLASSSLNSIMLTKVDFGYFKYMQAAISFLSVLYSLGIFSTLGVALISPGRFEGGAAGIVSGSLIFAILSGVILSITVIFLITYEGWQIVSYSVCALLFIFLILFPFLSFFQELLRSKADYLGLFLLNAVPPVIFLGVLLVARFANISAGWLDCLFYYLLSVVVVVVVLAIKSNILSYRAEFSNLRKLFSINRSIGGNVYLASLLGALVSQAGIFVIQFSDHSHELAVFSLAVTLTLPLTMLPSAIGTVYFGRFANSYKFPKGVLFYSWLMMVLVSVMFCFLLPYVVDFLYGDKYVDVVYVSYYCAVAAVLHGMGDIYNRYYLANSETGLLLRASALLALVSVVAALFLVHFYSIFGGGVARLLASASYLAIFTYFYHFKRLRYGDSLRDV